MFGQSHSASNTSAKNSHIRGFTINGGSPNSWMVPETPKKTSIELACFERPACPRTCNSWEFVGSILGLGWHPYGCRDTLRSLVIARDSGMKHGPTSSMMRPCFRANAKVSDWRWRFSQTVKICFLWPDPGRRNGTSWHHGIPENPQLLQDLQVPNRCQSQWASLSWAKIPNANPCQTWYFQASVRAV